MSIGSEPPSGEGGGEIVLFGVRVKVDPMRKSVSMNNLSEYDPIGKELPKPVAEGVGTAGYDAVPPANWIAERKRGVLWTEEEHKLFLLGLQKVGKGDWRGISRNYVKTRTPTQVASHAQKYFIRQSNLSRRRRRSSLFDITTDSVKAIPMEEVKSREDGTSNISVFHFNPNQKVQPLSLRLSLSSGPEPLPTNGSSFQVMSSFENGDSTISVS